MLRWERLVHLLGVLPERVPLDPRIEERVTLDGGIVRERLTYQVEPGDRAPAYLFLPTSVPAPAVVDGNPAHAPQHVTDV